jgi:vancomycin resistance protein YoaR
VAPGAALSFLQIIGEVSARKGYTSGQAIVNGEVRASIGGGICYLSTALYRAAFMAGLPIIERRPHSIALASLSDIPGFDSAVDTSGLDLRWQNDTPHTLLVMVHLNNGTTSHCGRAHSEVVCHSIPAQRSLELNCGKRFTSG